MMYQVVQRGKSFASGFLRVETPSARGGLRLSRENATHEKQTKEVRKLLASAVESVFVEKSFYE